MSLLDTSRFVSLNCYTSISYKEPDHTRGAILLVDLYSIDSIFQQDSKFRISIIVSLAFIYFSINSFSIYYFSSVTIFEVSVCLAIVTD